MGAIGDTPSELDRLLAKARSTGLTGLEHYQVAEGLLNEHRGEDGDPRLAAAQVHAALALAHDPVHRRVDTSAPPSQAFRDFVARIQRECNAITGMWEQLGGAEAAVRDEAEGLRLSDAAVRALVADRIGRPVPATTPTPDAVRMLISRLDAQHRIPAPSPAPSAAPSPAPPPARSPAPSPVPKALPAARLPVAAPRPSAAAVRSAANGPRAGRTASRPNAAVTCQSCGGRKKEGHYLCRVCWFMLPEATRTRLAHRDPLAYRRLAELHDQLRRDVPLTDITVREPL